MNRRTQTQVIHIKSTGTGAGAKARARARARASARCYCSTVSLQTDYWLMRAPSFYTYNIVPASTAFTADGSLLIHFQVYLMARWLVKLQSSKCLQSRVKTTNYNNSNGSTHTPSTCIHYIFQSINQSINIRPFHVTYLHHSLLIYLFAFFISLEDNSCKNIYNTHYITVYLVVFSILFLLIQCIQALKLDLDSDSDSDLGLLYFYFIIKKNILIFFFFFHNTKNIYILMNVVS